MTAAEFTAAIDAFAVHDLQVPFEPEADDRLRVTVAAAGVILLGEVHGIAQNPLVVYTLARRYDIRCIALEWPADADLADFDSLRHYADGRITAGHFAVLRALREEGRLDTVVRFSELGHFASWSARDQDMADRLLQGVGESAVIAAAGNLHTRLERHRHGIPMGVHVAQSRKAIEVRIQASGGTFYKFGRRRLSWRPLRRPGLRWAGTHAVFGIGRARVAAVPGGSSAERRTQTFL